MKLYVLTATAIPAQFTAMSNLPNFSLARDTADWTSASDVTWKQQKSLNKDPVTVLNKLCAVKYNKVLACVVIKSIQDNVKGQT